VLGAAAVLRFGFGYPGDFSCQFSEAREGSAYNNWMGLRLDDVLELADRADLSVHVLGTETIDNPGAEVTVPLGDDGIYHTRQPNVGETTSISQCRPAGVRANADLYVRVAAAP
jgi:hypothetical protein